MREEENWRKRKKEKEITEKGLLSKGCLELSGADCIVNNP
jgi:hypothetical protein